MRSCVVMVVVMLAALPAAADSNAGPSGPVTELHETTPRPPRREISAGRRALAVVAAIVPGFVARGLGSYLVGEKRAAKRLAIGAGGGLVLGGLAGGLVLGSGGSPYAMPAVPLLIAGTGALVTTWFTDIWVAAGGGCVCTGPRVDVPWSVETGGTWQHDAFRERWFARVAGRVDLGHTDLAAAGLFDAGGDAWLAFLDARIRLLQSGDSRLVARVGARLQRDDFDQLTQFVVDVELGGRLALARFDPALRTNFVEVSTGLAGLRASYAGVASDVEAILLGRFAWGAYLPTGELTLYYDHRRDGLAGGVAASHAAGFVGSVGANADIGVHGPWAVRGELQIGNAWVTTLALSYRGGSR